jgi:hypothetical protein
MRGGAIGVSLLPEFIQIELIETNSGDFLALSNF